MTATTVTRPTAAEVGFRPDWNRVYDEARIAEHGYTRESFLRTPERILRLVGQESAPAALEAGFNPLLPRQAAVAKRLWDQWKANPNAVAQ
jgi:hypothetical protein